jgi:hypothetical protein
MQNTVNVPGDSQSKNFTIINDGFNIKVNPEVLHEYADRNQMSHLSYSLVRACYLRDIKSGRV